MREAPPSGPKALIESPAVSNTIMTGLAHEMESLKGLVRELAVQVRRRETPDVPQELFEHYVQLVQSHFDLRPRGIIQMLDLLRPIYAKTAAYGHFGREEPEFSWEATDKAAALREAAGLKGTARAKALPTRRGDAGRQLRLALEEGHPLPTPFGAARRADRAAGGLVF